MRWRAAVELDSQSNLDAPSSLVSRHDAVLVVDDLRVRLQARDGWVDIVSGVSFALEAGMTLGLVGESGAGKSVTSLAILGLLDKEHSQVKGRILYRGKDLLTCTP